VPGRRSALHRLRNNGPPPDPELAGAAPVLGASNLVAACRRCNYGGGARVAAQNTRQTIERLQQIIGEQQQEIAQLAERLAHYEDQAAKRRLPAIH
jgi:hypothetical protein